MRSSAFESGTPQLPLWSSESPAENWTVRASSRARRLSVRVFRSGRVEVIVPPRISQRQVQQFVSEHREWIETRRAEAQRNAPPPEPFPPARIEFAACGETWRVHLTGGAKRLKVNPAADGILAIHGNTGDIQITRQALRRWLMKRAQEILAPMLAETARAMGIEYSKAVIRRQRSRWGSCSNRRTISLNGCLMFQRPEVVRYLFVHELSHTLHMNHSRRFWQAVARHCPDFQRLDRELMDGWRRVPAWVFDRPE